MDIKEVAETWCWWSWRWQVSLNVCRWWMQIVTASSEYIIDINRIDTRRDASSFLDPLRAWRGPSLPYFPVRYLSFLSRDLDWSVVEKVEVEVFLSLNKERRARDRADPVSWRSGKERKKRRRRSRREEEERSWRRKARVRVESDSKQRRTKRQKETQRKEREERWWLRKEEERMERKKKRDRVKRIREEVGPCEVGQANNVHGTVGLYLYQYPWPVACGVWVRKIMYTKCTRYTVRGHAEYLLRVGDSLTGYQREGSYGERY